MFCIPCHAGGIGYGNSCQYNHSAKAIESMIGTWALGSDKFLWNPTMDACCLNLGNILHLSEAVSPAEE